MEVILLQRVPKLGHMGEIVRVRDGYARNFLLPQGKALRATDANRKRFDGMKVELEARNLAQRGDAETVGSRLKGHAAIVFRQASEVGQLYGSVTTRDISLLLEEAGYAVSRSQVLMHAPIKTIGMHTVPISLHPEVEVSITVNVARNADEAERQARGENVTVRREEMDEEEAPAAEAFAEPSEGEEAEADQGSGPANG